MAIEVIEAKPTKKLFIETLTQDITIKEAILDLIDNSVDSYVRTKLTARHLIDLRIDKTSFFLMDNCGGINKQYLKENVFRFGNLNPQINDATLGMYGIGLKRAIFKLGKKITIETDDGVDYSKIELDVAAWQNSDEWSIPFETEQTKLAQSQQPYTQILITELNTEANEKFALVAFENDLKETVQRVYCLIIKDYIDFAFNSQPVQTFPLLVPLPDDNYSPQIYTETHDDILIEIICFIDPSKGKRLTNAINQRGWNLFCNRRLILSNDISEITGWRGSDQVKDKGMLPKYHSIYNEFRGLVFLSSKNPFKLPLNTSKTNLNIEDRNYNYILSKMILTARPIIDFLSAKYSTEKQKEEDIIQEISEAPNDNEEVVLKEVGEIPIQESSFRAPQNKGQTNKTIVRISYQKEKILADKIAQHLGVASYKEVGEKTFNYYLTMEGLNNE